MSAATAKWDGTIGDWTGRAVVITGANSGIGLEASRQLVEHGATVVMGCRDTDRGDRAAAGITGPGRTVVRRLDLADFDSVEEFSRRCLEEDGPLAGLVNNAGVMACPLAFTKQGYELQMGTNHLGHALLTSLLWPALTDSARVVPITSIAARGGHLTEAIVLEDLTTPVPYSPQTIYSNTKQANLLFAQELNRRAQGGAAAAGRNVIVVAAHPGVSATELFARQMRDSGKGWMTQFAKPVMSLIFQSARAGSMPTMRALSDQALKGGEFVGPKHLGQSRGAPELLDVYPQGADLAAASKLWELTEEIIGRPILA